MLARMVGRLARPVSTLGLLWSSQKPFSALHPTLLPSRELSSMSGVCFSPFPRNELEIVGFNLRQQLKRRQQEVEKQTDGIISDAKTVNGSEPLTLQDARTVLEARLKRPVSDKEARTCYERCLKAFDPLAHARLVSEQRARLDAALDAARETLRQQIADAAARGARLTVTRNYCGQLLEPHLGRFPDAPEVEELWTLQYMFPLATWEEGGEYSRDARDAAAANAFGQSGNDCL